jgi:hypothetical protein
MRLRLFIPLFTVGLSAALSWIGCGGSNSSSSNLSCGPGTTQQGSECVVSDASMAGDAPSGKGEAGSDGAPALPPTFGGVTSVAPASTTSLLVTWNPGADPSNPAAPLRYYVYVGPASMPLSYDTPTVMSGLNATSAIVGGLTTGTAYSVGVRAIDGAGLQDANTVVLPGTPAADTMPPTFAGLATAMPGGSGQVALTWPAASDDTTAAAGISYLVYMGEASIDSDASTAEDLSDPVLVTAPGATSATVSRLGDPSVTRYFIVRARDASGNVDSNLMEQSSAPGADTVAPVFSGCGAATNVQAIVIAVSWTGATDDVSDPPNITYDIYASKTSGSYDFTKPFAVVKGQTEAVLKELDPQSQYYFVCRAKDEAGNEDQNLVEVTAKTGTNPIPPTFGGITSFTPDPVNRTATLGWDPGVDMSGSGRPLVYDVYIANTAGGEDYNQPPFTTSAGGAMGMTVTNLPSNSPIYMVVRARDGDGNHDTSSPPVEKNMVTDVSFALDVQTIFTMDCGVVGCHVPGSPTGGLVLYPGFAYGNIVNVAAPEASKFTLDGGIVNYVTPFDPDDSFLNIKVNSTLYAQITGAGHSIGSQMPAPSTGSSLNTTELNDIALWITQGALNN